MHLLAAGHLLCRMLNQQLSSAQLAGEIERLSGKDWQTLLEQSAYQGVSGYLFYRLQGLGLAGSLPAEVHQRLHDAHLAAAGQNITMQHHAGIILTALKAGQLDVIPLKGIYLAEAVYPEIGLRTFGDLDFLVRRGDVPATLEELQGLGYRLTGFYDPGNPNRDIKHPPPLKKAAGPYLEVHWSLLEENEPFEIDVYGLWQRAEPARVAGVELLALSPEDLLLHLCLHFAFQHSLRTGLRSLLDIALLLEKWEDCLDWSSLADTARSWKAQRPTALSLSLAGDLLGAPLPAGVVSLLLPEGIDPALLAQAARQVLSMERENASLTPDLASLAQAGSPIGKIGLLLRRVFIPRRSMARLYNIPPHSARLYLYYPVRFLDLLRHYGGSAWRVVRSEPGALAALEVEQAGSWLRRWMTGG